MHSFRTGRPVSACVILGVLLPALSRADYLDDTGYRRLAAELGAAMPTGAGVTVSQVESPGAAEEYLPLAGTGTFPGTGTFAGATFTLRSGDAGTTNHAADVAYHFYGSNTNPAAGRATMSPGIPTVDLWRAVSSGGSADNWVADLLKNGSNAPPATQSRMVENHSWILGTGGASTTTLNDICRRLDFVIGRDRVLVVCGVNNYAVNTTPALLAAAYNNISAGLTSGEHSRGGTPAGLDGPGRIKPDIVAPLDYTSFSTGLTSSAATLLRERANGINTTNARAPQTLKAALLAGATRDRIPGWAKTATQPLDSVFGVGELNIYYSWHILNGLEQAPNLTTGRPARAWDLVSLSPSVAAEYRIVIPAASYITEAAAVAVWHSTITDTNASPGIFSPSRDALTDFNLRLFRDPVAGGATPVDSSTSTLYNVEMVRGQTLPPGTYRLRLERTATAGTAQEVAIAWRFETALYQPAIAISASGPARTISLSGLIAGLPHILQTSTNLQSWTTLQAFTPAGTSHAVIDSPTETRRFYRLTWNAL